MKSQDDYSAEIPFGFEIETIIPRRAGVRVGNYTRGSDLVSSYYDRNEAIIQAPTVGGHWNAGYDCSIRARVDGTIGCEFGSPILVGETGVQSVVENINFFLSIGATVNDSCGLHITVDAWKASGIDSADRDAWAKMAIFCHKLTSFSMQHKLAIYGQTGTGRHSNHYSHPIGSDDPQRAESLWKRASKIGTRNAIMNAISASGRGMVNFNNLLSGRIEFRAFAGTLSVAKALHHLSTVFALCNRARSAKRWGGWARSKKVGPVETAVKAVEKFHAWAGWKNSVPGRKEKLGLFGPLYSANKNGMAKALEMASKFDRRFGSTGL